MRRLARILLLAGAVIVGLFTPYVAEEVGMMLVCEKRGETIKAKYGHLVGSPSLSLSTQFRAPDLVEREAPIIYTSATGEVTDRLEPYIVWTYLMWPRLGPFTGAPLVMRVLIDDNTQKIRRFRGPGD